MCVPPPHLPICYTHLPHVLAVMMICLMLTCSPVCPSACSLPTFLPTCLFLTNIILLLSCLSLAVLPFNYTRRSGCQLSMLIPPASLLPTSYLPICLIPTGLPLTHLLVSYPPACLLLSYEYLSLTRLPASCPSSCFLPACLPLAHLLDSSPHICSCPPT